MTMFIWKNAHDFCLRSSHDWVVCFVSSRATPSSCYSSCDKWLLKYKREWMQGRAVFPSYKHLLEYFFKDLSGCCDEFSFLIWTREWTSQHLFHWDEFNNEMFKDFTGLKYIDFKKILVLVFNINLYVLFVEDQLPVSSILQVCKIFHFCPILNQLMVSFWN